MQLSLPIDDRELNSAYTPNTKPAQCSSAVYQALTRSPLCECRTLESVVAHASSRKSTGRHSFHTSSRWCNRPFGQVFVTQFSLSNSLKLGRVVVGRENR